MISFDNVSMKYRNGTVALNDVTLNIDDGEFVFIIGHSGAGKTTLTKLLLCEERVSSGHLEVNGFRLDKIRSWKIPALRRTMGVVFQDFKLFDKMTVYENVAFAMRVIGASNREIKKRVPYVLDLVDLSGREDRYPRELSGGEQQRVAIARALVNSPDMIIADEPTGNLDPARSLEIMLLFQKINELGTTVLIVTHEKELVNAFSKRVVSLSDGCLISDGMDGYYGYES